jgi:hypothetical protein
MPVFLIGAISLPGQPEPTGRFLFWSIDTKRFTGGGQQADASLFQDPVEFGDPDMVHFFRQMVED